MSDPKHENQEAPQSPDVTPPDYETFRKSSVWNMSGRVGDLESEFVRLNTTLENFATKSDLRDVKDELTKEITNLDQKLSKEITNLDQKLSKEITNLDQKLSKEIAGFAEKLTSKMTSSNRFIAGSFLIILTIIPAITVLVLNWLWDLRGNSPVAPVAPVAPVVNFYTTGETPHALPPQADPAVTRSPARQPPSLAAETAPAPSTPETDPVETGRTAGRGRG